MPTPDYDDPKSKLKLRLRPPPGSETILGWGSGLSGLGVVLGLSGFAVSFIPGVQVDGNRMWFLAGAAGFAGGLGVFYLGHRLVRRLR